MNLKKFLKEKIVSVVEKSTFSSRMYDVRAPDHLTNQKGDVKNSMIIEPKDIRDKSSKLRSVSKKRDPVIYTSNDINIKSEKSKKIKLNTKNGDLKIKEKGDASGNKIISISNKKKQKKGYIDLDVVVDSDADIVKNADADVVADADAEIVKNSDANVKKVENNTLKKLISKSPSKTSSKIKSMSPDFKSDKDIKSDDEITDFKIEDIVQLNKGLFYELNKKIDPNNDMMQTASTFGFDYKPSNGTESQDYINNYLSKLKNMTGNKGGKCNIVYDDGSEYSGEIRDGKYQG